MKLTILSFALFSLLVICLGEKKRYDGYKVVKVTPQNEADLQFLLNLEKSGVDFWDGPNVIGRESDIMLSPEQLQEFARNGMSMTIRNSITDVQQLIDSVEVSNEIPLVGVLNYNWTQYHNVATIHAWLKSMGAAHESAKAVVIGQSYENQDLLVMHISKGNVKKPAVFLDCNIHAREWVTNAVCMYLIKELLTNDEMQGWTDDLDWYILPMANPDGYRFTISDNRLWRRTRKQHAMADGTTCIGADPNRNFGFHWMETGATRTCTDTFGGPWAFSENESLAIAEFINTLEWQEKGSVVGFFSIHAYSQLILIPNGHSPERIEDYDKYKEISKRAIEAHKKHNGTVYEADNIVKLLYAAAGGSIDWAKGTHDIPFSIAYEMRDKGQFGFLLPPEQIIPASIEFLDGFEVWVDAMREHVKEPSKDSGFLLSSNPFTTAVSIIVIIYKSLHF